MIGLTHRQRELLNFISAHVKEQGRFPTTEKMRVALGLASRGAARRLLNGLIQRGHLHRTFKGRRRVELVKPEHGNGSNCDCARCLKARYAAHQQFVEALKVSPPPQLLDGTNFRPLRRAQIKRPASSEVARAV